VFEIEFSSLSVNHSRMKPLRVLGLGSAAMLVAGLYVFAGCGKPAASAPATTTAAAPAMIEISEPTEAQPKLPTVKLYVGAEQMDAEMCSTPRQTQTGMMFRKTMGTNDGMLFSLRVPQQAGFWMKNCFVPLSVAYIDPDGVIEEIHPLQVQDTNTVISTANNIEFALETPQGWFDQHHITTGMVIRTERGTLLETFGQRN
jgi:uncharacterized membrane protein (UPF0127 family)